MYAFVVQGIETAAAQVAGRSADFQGAVMWYHEPASGFMAVQDVRLRRRGLSETGSDKIHLKVEFDRPLRPGGTLETGLLDMSSPRRPGLRAYPLIFRLASRLGLAVPECRWVEVRMNGKSWGLFLEMERFGRRMLERNGLGDGDLYVDSDAMPVLVGAVHRWHDLTHWEIQDADEAANREVAPLHAFLDFVHAADDAEFRARISDFIDFDNVVNWAVLEAVVNSHHQCHLGNSRLFFGRRTGRLSILPWDIVPWAFSRDRYDVTFANDVLLVRLLNDPRFLEAFARRLGEVVPAMERDLDGWIREIYLGEGVRSAVASDLFRKQLPGEATPGAFLRALRDGDWDRDVAQIRDWFAMSLARLRRTHLEPELFVSALAPDGPAREWTLDIAWRGHGLGILDGVDLPLSSGGVPGDGTRVEVRLEFAGEPSFLRFPHRIVPPEARAGTVDAAVRDGVLRVEGLGWGILPDVPQVAGVENDVSHVRERRATLCLSFACPVRFADAPPRLRVRNPATGAEVTPRTRLYRERAGAERP